MLQLEHCDECVLLYLNERLDVPLMDSMLPRLLSSRMKRDFSTFKRSMMRIFKASLRGKQPFSTINPLRLTYQSVDRAKE